MKLARILFVGACATPVLTLAAALATRTGLLTPEVGYDLLARKALFGLAVVGVLAGLGLAVIALRDRGARWLALIGLVVSLATLGGFIWATGQVARTVGEDVSTDLAEIPGFGVLARSRTAQGLPGTVGVQACPGALPATTQALPEAVVYELQTRGVAVRRAGVTGVYGSRRGFWFGFTHDVVIRIRPGRTDIRVAARDGRPHGNEACRLATELSTALRVGERASN